jgi:protein phosphatase
MPFTFRYAARSDVGMVRSNNQDSGYAGPHLLAMADGMGGHAGGDIASSTVIAALVDLDDEALGSAEAGPALLERIAAANAELGERAKAEPRLDGMGTTLIAMLRTSDKIVLAHIGDSRAFLVRDGEVTQITKDHSFVQSLVDEGRITSEEAAHHPQRSLVTRVLTGQATDEPDLVVRQARVGDRYVIASDGLTDYVAADTVSSILVDTADPAEACERLVALALRAGAPDNVTVVVGDVVDAMRTHPSTAPQVVGAAARERGTRPMATTPAAKAAELARSAAPGGGDDHDMTLAEEGPSSRAGRIGRWLGALVLAVVIVVGGSYAAYSWTQQQYFVGVVDGQVTVFQGVQQDFGPLSLSSPVETSDVSVSDLPAIYQTELAVGADVGSREEADALVANLRVQAAACRFARAQGQQCQSVPPTWTEPTTTPTPSSSRTPTPSTTAG